MAKTQPINSTKAAYPMSNPAKIISYEGDRKARVGSSEKKNPIPTKNIVKGCK